MQRLTSREREIVFLLIDGCRNRDIAVRFGTREQTVKNQLTRIYEKTGTHSRLELVLYAMKRGYLPGGRCVADVPAEDLPQA